MAFPDHTKKNDLNTKVKWILFLMCIHVDQDHAMFLVCSLLNSPFCKQLYGFFPKYSNCFSFFLLTENTCLPILKLFNPAICVVYLSTGTAPKLSFYIPICTARAGDLWTIFPRKILPVKSTRGWMGESISPALFWWRQLYVTTVCGLVVGVVIVVKLLCTSSQRASSWLPDEWQ